jgi:hypothetical protein
MILAALVISLIVYRKWVAKDEDNSLRVTVAALVLGAGYLYQNWPATGSILAR